VVRIFSRENHHSFNKYWQLEEDSSKANMQLFVGNGYKTTRKIVVMKKSGALRLIIDAW